MVKKHEQSSGGSYSLLALLKRTLFLHETAMLDELVDDVHEYMLKDQTSEQIKQRYVEPILRSNPSFVELRKGSNEWKLTEGNKVNDSIYELFKKHREPLSERQILNRLAKEQHLAKINLVLDLKNDARFLDIENGKYWILSEWIVINEYARSLLLRTKVTGLTEAEILEKVASEYHVDPEKAIFLPILDERFVKKEKQWTLKRFADQKTKLRPSRIDRLYKHLQKAGEPLSADELTTIVLNMPASSTDVEEKFTTDPRFVRVNDKWDLRERSEKRLEPEKVSIPEPLPVQEPSIAVEPELPLPEPEIAPEAPLAELPIEPEPSVIGEETIEPEPLPMVETTEPEPVTPEELPPLPEIPEETHEAVVAEAPAPIPEPELAPEHTVEAPPMLEKELPAELLQPELEEIPVAEPAAPVMPEQAEQAELPQEQPESPVEELEQQAEWLRKQVVEFLQEAFHSERIVYSADIIDQLATAEDRVELFEQFSLEHFPNPARNRELTDSDIVKFMVYLTEPTLNDKIIDPCCGTGSVLVQLLNTLHTNLHDASWREKDLSIEYELPSGQFYFVQLTPEERRLYPTPLHDTIAKYFPIVRFCKQQQLTGVDLEAYAYKTTKLNLALHGFPEIVLHQENALTTKQIGSGLYDVVIGNPPAFHDSPTRFLRRSLTLAKPGGRILLLLPETMFSEFRLISGSLRNQIAAQTIVKAVIEFPAPYNEKAYGPKRILLSCIKKQLDADQQSEIFLGRIPDFDGLREIIEVLEDPTVPVSENETPLPLDLVTYILASYRDSAYTLLLEGLRRQVLEGMLISMDEWTHFLKASEEMPEEPVEE